jgi:hypothetical protein
MMHKTRNLILGLGLAVLSGCGLSLVPEGRVLSVGSQIPVLSLLQDHAGQTACLGYDQGSDSCKSILNWTLAGDRMVMRETGFGAGADGAPKSLQLVSVGQIVDDAVCLSSQNVGLGETELTGPQAEFALTSVRAAIASRGGVCTRYFAAPRGDGFIARTLGADGRTLPPGDFPLTFFPTPKSVRP